MPTNRADHRRKKNAGHRLNLESLESRILLSGGSPTGGAVPEEQQGPEPAPGQILVGMDGPVRDASAYIDRLYPGAEVLHEYRTINAVLVGLPDGDTVDEGVDRMQGQPSIRYAQPDYLLQPLETFPNEPQEEFDKLWGLHNTGQTGATPDADIDAPEAWDFTTGSSEVVVGVIDTGVEYWHEDLADNMWQNPGEIPGNGIDDDQNGYVDDVFGWDFFDDDNEPWDSDGHGTHVAGTLGAVGNNGTGVVGVNWNVRIAALRFLGPGGGLTSDAIEAVEYAVDMGFDLTNNSWGGGPFNQALYDAIDRAGDNGQLFVAAAGNDGLDNDQFPHYPSNYDLDNIISVAATGPNDELAWYSNYGETSVDLAAPGGALIFGQPEDDIYSTMPGGSYGYLAGTSMASPHVAGAAALLKSYNGGASAQEVKSAIMNGVDEISSLDGLMVTGGRLNLVKAIGNLPSPIQGIDIQARSVSLDSAALFGATRLDGEYTIMNLGDTGFTDDFQVDMFFSDDSALGGGDDQLIESITVSGGLAPFQRFRHSFSIPDIPSADPFGTDGDYYLLVAADTGGTTSDGQIAEVDEENNTVSTQVLWDRGAVFEDDFSTDKGWTGFAPGAWERGPAEEGGGQFGVPDPAVDTTPTADNYLLGYNIGGDYQNGLPSPVWITSPTIDLSNIDDTRLEFQRWLNVEYPWWDQASIEVFDGTDWVRIWENQTEITDASWNFQAFDISAYADDNSNFRIRFGMGPTDSIWRYSGWNIDDLRIVGDLPGENTAPQVSDVQVRPGRTGASASVRLQFNEGMALFPLSEPDNYEIEDSDGDPVMISSIDAGPDYVDLFVGSGLIPGEPYQVTAFSGGLVDNWGNALDGDEDGLAGGDFQHTFTLPGLFAGSMEAYGGYLTFYDTDAMSADDIDVRPTARVMGTESGGISNVVLTPQYSAFGVVIEQQPGSTQAFGITDQTFSAFPISYIIANGNVSSVSLRSDLDGINLNGVRLGQNLAMAGDIDGDGSRADETGFASVGAGVGDVTHIESSAEIGGDMVVGGNLRSAAFGGSQSVVNGDVAVKGDLFSFALNGSGLNGNMTVNGRLSMLAARSGINGKLTAGSIASARLLGPSGISGAVETLTGDIDFIASSDPISTPIETMGRIGTIVAMQGIESTADITAGAGLGTLFSRGDVDADITVDGNVDLVSIMDGDLVGSLQVSNGNVGRVVIARGSVAGGDWAPGISITDGSLGLLQIHNPAGMAVNDEIFVGDRLERAVFTGSVGAPVTAGDGEDGDGLGSLLLRGDLDADLMVDGDLGVFTMVGGQVTNNHNSDARISVTGRAGTMQIVGYTGAGAAIQDDVSVGGRIDRFVVNGNGSTGTLTANSMGTVVYRTASGVQGDIHAQTNLDVLHSLGPVNATVRAGRKAGTIFIAGDVGSGGVIDVGSGRAGDRLAQLTVRGDFLGTAKTDGDLSRVSISGGMGSSGSGALIDVDRGDVDRLAILGDMVNADVEVDETLASVLVGRNFSDSGIDAGDMNRVVVRGAISGQGIAEDKIHAATGRFDLFAGGFFYDIDGTSRNLNGVAVSVG